MIIFGAQFMENVNSLARCVPFLSSAGAYKLLYNQN